MRSSNFETSMRRAGGRLAGWLSVVIGGITILLSMVPFLNIVAVVTGILGIIAGAIGIKQYKKAQQAAALPIVGLVLSIVGIVLVAVVNWVATGRMGGR